MRKIVWLLIIITFTLILCDKEQDESRDKKQNINEFDFMDILYGKLLHVIDDIIGIIYTITIIKGKEHNTEDFKKHFDELEKLYTKLINDVVDYFKTCFVIISNELSNIIKDIFNFFKNSRFLKHKPDMIGLNCCESKAMRSCRICCPINTASYCEDGNSFHYESVGICTCKIFK
jgi:hypothetical protein